MTADSDVYQVMLSAWLGCGPGVVPQALIDRCMGFDEAARKDFAAFAKAHPQPDPRRRGH